MKVCMLVYAFYETDTRVMQYATALAERGESVDVIALRKDGTAAFEVIEGVNVYRIQDRKINEQSRFDYLFRIIRFLLASAFFLTKKHLSSPYRVIHVHSVPDFLVFAALVPKLRGARVILDIHDILPEFYASKFNIGSKSLMFKIMVVVEKLSVAFADHVIIANDLWRERLVARSVRADKCTTFINYPDSRIFYPRPKPAHDGKFVIIYPGTLNAHQGLDIALRAFARIASGMPNAEFHIYGDGPTKPSLRHLAHDLGLSERVIFHPFLSVREVAPIMATSDLAVVPKRASSSFGNEAASTKIMEFMSEGVPVVVSRTRVDTFYHDDSRVRFFESENESDLAESILLLYRNPQLRRELVSNAFEYVRQNNWQERKIDYFRLVDNRAPDEAIAQNGAWHGVTG